MGLAKTEEELADRLSTFLKAELKRAKMTYADLAKALEAHGLKGETEHSVKSKLKRGTFPATFLVATVAALGLEHVAIEDI
jgi:hypothetical protein